MCHISQKQGTMVIKYRNRQVWKNPHIWHVVAKRYASVEAIPCKWENLIKEYSLFSRGRFAENARDD
jgi:predicted HD phosphohydrolase